MYTPDNKRLLVLRIFQQKLDYYITNMQHLILTLSLSELVFPLKASFHQGSRVQLQLEILSFYCFFW